MNRRSDYKDTPNALIDLRQEPGREKSYIPENERSRQRPFDEELQAKLEWLSLNWMTHFAQSCSSSSSAQNWWQHEHEHQSSQWHGHQNTQGRDHQWQDHDWSEDLVRSCKLFAQVPSEDQQDYQWQDREGRFRSFFYNDSFACISKCRARDGEWSQNTSSHAHFSQSCCVWHAHAWALLPHVRMRGSSLHKSLCTCDVWSGLRHGA